MKLSSTLGTLLQTVDVKGALFDPNKVKKIKQLRYLSMMRGINVLSHSTSERLIACERKFACNKMEQNKPLDQFDVQFFTGEGNIDFAFGRAIETGVQSALLGHSREQTFFDMFLAWDIDLMAQRPEKNKSFTHAWIAIEQFFYIKEQLMQDWEIAMFNGKPAIELALCIDMENGYYYVGHADIILYNPILNKYRVLEIKTTGYARVDEAMYKNSGQGTGYSIFLDNIAKDVEAAATFEVIYLVFPTSDGYWKKYDFIKSRSSRADWLNTVLLDMQRIDTYRKVNFWPKRGGACYNYYRQCEYFDRCDLDLSTFNESGSFALVGPDEIAEHNFDFKFKLSEILETQRELVK